MNPLNGFHDSGGAVHRLSILVQVLWNSTPTADTHFVINSLSFLGWESIDDESMPS